MNKPRPSNPVLIAIAIAWQLVVCVLSVSGVFVDIFNLLGIPWNCTGLTNVIGTAVGFVLLELPLVAALTYVLWRRSQVQYESH